MIMSRNVFKLVLVSLFLVTGCAASKPLAVKSDPTVVIDESPAETGPVEKADFSPDTWVYRNPSKSPLDYAQVILSPVMVYENMASEVKKRDRRYLQDVGASFSNRLERVLSKDYMPVPGPGPLALRIDIELVELNPGTRIFRDRREKIKLDKFVSGTKLEAACYDSMTGELIFAVSTFYKGDEYAAYKNPVLIKNIRGAYGEWLEHFKKRFDQEMTFN